MDKNSKPIAVMDSGVGGISVLKELVKILPNENYIYFGDNINAPYGTKTAKEVLDIMIINVEKMIELGAKAIVIACNTATASSAKELREKYPNLDIIGIEPAIKPSVTYKEHSNVLVMATPLTLKQDKFQNLMDRFSDEVNLILLPCPGLMELVEAGEINGKKIDDFLNNLLLPYKDINIDSVVLGCTHYPHAREAIKKAIGKEVMIFDGGIGTAKETKRKLEARNILNSSLEQGKIEYISTNNSDNFEDLCKKLMELQ